MKKAYFQYYETFENILEKIKDDTAREHFRRVIIRYGLYGTEPHGLTDIEDMAWGIIKDLIDQQQHRREINAANRAAKKAEATTAEAATPEPATEPAPAQEPEGKPEEKPKRQEKRANFVKPTREEITAFCEEKGLKINVNKFYLHYESNGWHVGKSKMKSWKASVQKWAETEKDFENHGKAAGTMWANNSADADTSSYEDMF